jgi:hypothetical protein
MKYCYNCGRINAGDPLFCTTCGRTFDKKLCPRHHPNPRSADVCSRCGSKDLSTPQPKVAIGWKFLEWLLKVALGCACAFLALFFVLGILRDLLGSPVVQSGLLVIGGLLFLLAWMWAKLPGWFRNFVRKQLRKRRNRHEEA